MENAVLTYYDSPQRTTKEIVEDLAEKIKNKELVLSLLEGFPELAVILDENRQIVAANSKAVAGFRKLSIADILGKRIGEAISCIHRDEMGRESCGTSKFCAECGAAHAIKTSKETNVAKEEECRITSEFNNREESFDFRVYASPVEIDNKSYTLFSISDISSEKRKEALEKIFFHDVLNTASVVNNFVHLLEDADENDFNEIFPPLVDSSNQLIQEIQTQRDLRNAEKGNLFVDTNFFSINELLTTIYSQYSMHQLAKGKKITLVKNNNDIKINSDKRLIARSFGNLVKNAIEASQENDEIKVFSSFTDKKVTLSVYNPMVIPERIQLQIFQRSFTTKGGSGRGIGTYSAKLLIEQYLNGKVYFISNKESGTIFSIEIPYA